MRNSRCFQGLLVIGAAALLSVPLVRGDVVYDNSVNDQNTRFNPGAFEVGDEIILAGLVRRLTTFSFEYWGTGFNDNERARVRFYANDGPPASGYSGPGTLLFDSGLFPIVATNRATVNFDGAALNAGSTQGPFVDVPDRLTWTVQFTGIDAGEGAGLDIYAPPTVGLGFRDYWQNNGGTWVLYTNSLPVDFAAHIEATVPEPAPMGFLVLAALAGAFVLRCRSRV